MEHRWGRRTIVKVPVRLITETGEPAAGQTENISISGAFIRTAHLAPLWSRLEVEFTHADGLTEEPERIGAHVTRRTHEGLGIEWYELAPHTVRALLLPAQPRSARQARHDTRREVHPALELQAKVSMRIDSGPPHPRMP